MTSPAVDLLTVREAAEQRRSIRSYTPEPIPREDLNEILRVASLAPSAFNAQPWRFVVVETPSIKQQLAMAANNQRQILSAPTAIVLYTDMGDTLASVDEILHPGMDAAKRAQARDGFIKAFGAQSETDREIWAAGQGYIALGYLLLAAEAHGYQTSPMLGFNAGKVKELLDLPPHVRVPAIVAIGKGNEEGFPSHRHPVGRIARFV